MDLDKQIKEIEAKKEILNFISLFGLKDDVKHIIDPEGKEPIVTFEPKTQDDFKRIFNLLKPSIHKEVIKEKNGTTAFKPIARDETTPEGDNITLLNSGVMIQTETIKYPNYLKIRFFVDWIDKNKFLDIWLSGLTEWFKDFLTYETITDIYETNKARSYNMKHAEIKTKIPYIEGLAVVKFWGGHYTHYSINDQQTKLIKRFLENE